MPSLKGIRNPGGGVIRSDVGSKCTCSKGKFEPHALPGFKNKVPLCSNCKGAPRLLLVRIHVRGIGTRDLRFTKKGTRISSIQMADRVLRNLQRLLKRRDQSLLLPYFGNATPISPLVSLITGDFLKALQVKLSSGDVSPSYVADAESLILSYINPALGHMRVSQLRRHHLDDFLSKPSGTERQRAKALALFRRILKWSEPRFSANLNAIPLFPPLPTAKRTRSIPDNDLREKIFGCVRNHQGAIRTGFIYPVNPCEIRALRWSDIDFEKGEVSFNVRYSKNTLIPQSKASTTYYIPKPCVFKITDEFKEILLSTPKLCPSNPDEVVFKTKYNDPLSINAMTREWKKACLRAGEPKLEFYSFLLVAARSKTASEVAVSTEYFDAFNELVDERLSAA